MRWWYCDRLPPWAQLLNLMNSPIR
jgi:hypothetical protein